MIFLFAEIDGRGMPDALGKALNQQVTQFLVEFLDQGGVKPHVTFKLSFAGSVSSGEKLYTGCRISMDYTGTGDRASDGEFRIKLLNYDGSSASSYASFQFGVKVSKRLRSWMDEIRTLVEFDFGEVNAHGNMAGCRDFM